MASGGGYVNYRTQRPSPDPGQVGQMLMQQGQQQGPPQGPPPEEMMGGPEPGMEPGMGGPPMAPQPMGGMEDDSSEFSPTSTAATLQAAIERALSNRQQPQHPAPRAPLNRPQMQLLGMPQVEMDINAAMGLPGGS